MIIKDTTPDVLQHLEATGWKIEHLKDGTVKLTADTGPALTDVRTRFRQRHRVRSSLTSPRR
ncbi:hypothetical protein [Nocardia vaccinii]|uniref:hypothetical protein n=1 Tax=Nocardia vaccinii TaxID=1822 RepID=UPI00082A4E11|nr:hypothetical protein [Nocardia vaccinii]